MYPLLVVVKWDLNPPTDAVDYYGFQLDSQAEVQVPATGSPVQINVSVPAAGPHTFTVRAHNLLGFGPAVSVTVQFPSNVPQAVVNLTVTIS